MKASAKAFGAATIVNAIATGKGAAYGISLQTKATVKLNDSGTFKGRILGSPEEDTKLIECCARKVLDKLGLRYGAEIETESDIPIAAGLKSSSTAANAVALATCAAAGKNLSDLDLINAGVDAALEAKVTITGAFDDAAASYLGGYVVTDNTKREIIRQGRMPDDLNVLIFLPEQRIYTASVDAEKTKGIAPKVLDAWNTALKGDLYAAIKENGILYSEALGLDPGIAKAAMDAGALTAGLTGKGPAVVALTKSDPGRIMDAWKGFEGRIIETGINNKKAEVI